MINWANQPPQDAGLPHLPLVRVPTRGAIKGAITCTELLQVWTHFMSRRTQPCLTHDCPGCQANLARRYEAYVSIWTTAPSRHLICALTPNAAEQLLNSAPDPHNLRAVCVVIQRLGNRANGRLTAKIDDTEVPVSRLPPIPEMIAHLLRIWGLDQAHLGQDQPGYAAAVRNQYNRSAAAHGS